jgi:hypothetical protein
MSDYDYNFDNEGQLFDCIFDGLNQITLNELKSNKHCFAEIKESPRDMVKEHWEKLKAEIDKRLS